MPQVDLPPSAGATSQQVGMVLLPGVDAPAILSELHAAREGVEQASAPDDVRLDPTDVLERLSDALDTHDPVVVQ